MGDFRSDLPLGTDDPQVFFANVGNLDEAVTTRESETWVDRKGVTRQTWYGMEEAFQEFLINSGYENIGDYGPGLNITARNQIFWKDGELYRASGSLALPYTTTGDWVTEESLFVAVGDDSLRQDLSNATDTEKGASMVGRAVVAVDSIDDLIAIPSGGRRSDLRYLVRGYYAGTDVGGGEFYWDEGSAHAPDGGAYIGASGGVWVRIIDGSVTPEMYGIKGDGSDETTLIQSMLDFSVGKTISWPSGGTYGYSFLVIPDDVSWSGTQFTLRRLFPDVSPGIRINNWFRAESMVISTPGGDSGDIAIRWQGSNSHIGHLDIRSDVEGIDSSTNWAIEMESAPIGTNLTRNSIGAAYCENFSTFLFGKNVSLLNVENVTIEKYRTAVYFRDITRSRLINVKASGLGNAVNGRPGENGLLLEATGDNATSDVVIENWTVEDSGEHAYRLGGQRTISNVWFNYCVARRSGSSILSGNLSSGEWHGGCGFKVLGGATVGGTRHKNIFFNQCEVYDVNQTEGAYPAGHGVNNFTPYMIVLADNVHLNNCLIDAEQMATSCRQGLLVGHCNGVFVNNCSFLKCNLVAIKPYQEFPFAGSPGYLTSLENFHVRGGLFEVTTTAAGSGIVYYFSDTATITNRRLTVKGAEFRGGASALRIDAVGSGGAFNNCTAEFTYNGPTSVTESTTTLPITTGGSVVSFLINAVADARPNATNSARLGSIITEFNTGVVKILKSSGWTPL